MQNSDGVIVDAVSLTDEQIIERCKQAGIRWAEPDGDPDGFPGMFDMATMSEMRALLTGGTAGVRVPGATQQLLRDLITLASEATDHTPDSFRRAVQALAQRARGLALGDKGGDRG